MSLTVDDIDQTPEAEVRQLLSPGDGDYEPRFIYVRKARDAGLLAPTEDLFLDVFIRNAAPLHLQMQVDNNRGQSHPAVAPIIAALGSEDRALYMIFRLLVHTGIALMNLYGLPLTALVNIPPTVTVQPTYLASAEVVQQTELPLVLDYLIALPKLASMWTNTRGAFYSAGKWVPRAIADGRINQVESVERVTRVWQTAIQVHHTTETRVYIMLRSWKAWLSYLRRHPEEEKKMAVMNPGTPTTATALIHGMVQSLTVHLARQQLNPTSRVYHQYVLRTLQNYLLYGETRLRGSDLTRGDPIFTAEVSIFDHLASETAEGLHGLIEDYVVPVDQKILQRIGKTVLS